MAAELREDVAEEMLVLPEIYGSSFELRPSVWNYPSFAIKLTSTANSSNGRTLMYAVVKFSLSASYPKTGPKYEVEDCKGLSIEEKKGLSAIIESCIKENLGNVMIYDIVSALQSYIDNDVESYKAETFYDAMIRRENEKTTFVENLKKSTQSQESPKNADKKGQERPPSLPAPAEPLPTSLESLDITTKLGYTKIDAKKAIATPARMAAAQSAESRENEAIAAAAAQETAKKSAPSSDSHLDEEGDDESDEKDGSSALYYDNSKSRYAQEFAELHLLGNGASGEVWQVRHKLDRRVYAVKKIDLNARNNAAGNKIQREVTTISRLIHKNIVRYYAAWIEQYEATTNAHVAAAEPSTSQKSRAPGSASSSNIWLTGNAFTQEAEREAWSAPRHADDLLIAFESSSQGEEDVSTSNFGMSRKIRPMYQFDSSDEDEEDSESDEDDENSEEEDEEEESHEDESEEDEDDEATRSGSNDDDDDWSSSSRKSALPKIARWMFIQMEYCCTTLRAEIDKKELWSKTEEVNRLLRQMLEALAYMHKCKVIHRDLKPANIFLDEESNIKLGDFGLATSNSKREQEKERQIAARNEGSFDLATEHSVSHFDLSAHTNTQQENMDSLTLTAGIGTALYRAPEQELVLGHRAGNADEDEEDDREYTVPYNEKADMYSLGIILFEMCHKPFGTGMERLVTVKQLREKMLLPEDFAAYVPPPLVKIILWLTQHDPKQRPSAAQLLASDLMPARADVDSQYLKEITEALYKPNSAASGRILSILFKRDKPLFVDTAREQDESELFDYAALRRIEVLLIMRAMGPQRTTAQSARHARNSSVSSSGAHAAMLTENHALSLAETDGKRRMVIPLQYFAAVKRRLRAIFELRGAVDFFSQLLELRCTARASLSNIDEALKGDHLVELLDPSGQIVVLQPDLLTTFARLAAMLNITSSRRFCFDRVYAPCCSPADVDDASHVQPWNEEEAAYDVVAPATHAAQEMLVDVEVLDTLRAVLITLHEVLPPTAIRITHTALTRAVLSLCCYDGEASLAEIKPDAELLRRLQRVLTQIPDCASLAEAQQLVSAQGALLPARTAHRLLAVAEALVAQNPHVYSGDPLHVLQALEDAFFNLVKDASGDVAKDLKEKDKDKEKSGAKAAAAAACETAKSVAPKTAADFTPLNLNHIGVKTKTATGAPPGPASAAAARREKEKEKEIVIAAAATDAPIKRRERGYSLGSPQSEKTIMFELAALFQQGRQHLKDVFSLLALQKSMRDLLNANSDVGDLGVLENNLVLRGSFVVLDLGVDAIFSPFNVNPYLSEGIRFVAESFQVVSKSEAVDATPTAAAENTKRESKKRASNVPAELSQPQTAQQSGSSSSTAAAPAVTVYKRIKRGVLADGGHFEKLLSERRAQLRGRHEATKVVACGLRVHLENLVTMIQRHDARSRAKVGLNALQFAHTERLVALVVTTTNTMSAKADSSPAQPVDARSAHKQHAKSLAVVTNWLQSHHIRASHSVHMLQAHQAHSSLELCQQLEIPVLVTVDPDNYAQVDVQMVSVDSSSSSSPVSMPLRNLHTWILENLHGEYFRFSQASSLSPAVASTSKASKDASSIEEDAHENVFAVNVVNSTSSSDNDILTNKKKKKELDALTTKLQQALTTVSSVAAKKVSCKSLIEAAGKANYCGLIQVVELPVALLRTVNTLLMCKSANPATFKTEFEALIAEDFATVYRKVLKNYVTALVAHMQIFVSKSSEVGKTTGGKSSSSSSSTTTTIKMVANARQVVHTFSPIDEFMDLLHVVPDHIVQLRGIV